MEGLQLLLKHFPAASQADVTWLKEVFTLIKEQMCPSLPVPALYLEESVGSEEEDVCDDSNPLVDQHAFDLTLNVVKTIQELKHSDTICLNYRLVSVTELLSHQRLPCVSDLSCSTSHQKARIKTTGVQQPLPSVNLLLVGWMKTGENGDWLLTDRGGTVRCECLCPCPLWRDRPVLLPHWNFIPHDSEEGGTSGGHLELVDSPVLLSNDPPNGPLPAPSSESDPTGVISVREAAGILSKKNRGRRLSVFGKVSSVSPLLVIAGTSFFCLSLTDDTQTLPVVVKESTKLWWNHRVSVGRSICFTALRVCTLRVWRKNSLLCVTEQSEMISDHMPKLDVQDCAQSDWKSGTALSLTPALHQGPEPAKQAVQSTVRFKQSRLISYQGTVTEVVSQGAGLYVLDKEIGLCLAYQPSLRRSLRFGDVVEISNVHFLYCPCPDFPPTMLCACLHSTLKVKTFSRVMPPDTDHTCPDDGVLPKLLLEKNIGVSEYLWTCHLSSQLRRSLLDVQYCVCELSWKLMEHLLGCEETKRRDIYSEMLDQPHSCVLNQYNVDHAVHQSISVSDLTESLQSECWSSLCLRSQLSFKGSGLTSVAINSALSWSCRILGSDPRKSAPNDGALRQRPMLVIGILELPPKNGGHTLSLRDGTGTIACVLTEAGTEGQGAASNTSWIGCLVCVHQFDMVMERFLQSEFPSEQHLEQDSFIKHRECRVYLQFSLDNVHILSPSAAMVTHLQHREAAARTKQKIGCRQNAASMTICHSLVVRVAQKEGVTLKNTRDSPYKQEAWLTPSFSVRVNVIGPVCTWVQDPKNCRMTNGELGAEEKVTLVCSGVSSCWFPLLQPGLYYRLVARNSQSSTILSGVRVSGKSDSTLQVQPEWRFYTLTPPLLLSDLPKVSSLHILTISEVLESSSLSVVSFRGMVSERITLNDQTVGKRTKHPGLRLTMFDRSGRSLQVYMDLNNVPNLLGLLPGNTLLFSGFQRRIAKSGSVYCSYLPISCVTVVRLGNKSSAQPPPAPAMLLGQWALRENCAVGQVKGHVVLCLSLDLHWSCSLCGDIYTTASARCQCLSASAVFISKAKLVIEDGTGEAHVWFSGQQVQSLLGLADPQWEGLQRAVRAQGPLKVLPQARNTISSEDDPLYHFLEWVCRSRVTCRQLTLSCRRSGNLSKQDVSELQSFTRGDRTFMTKRCPKLQLSCVCLLQLT